VPQIDPASWHLDVLGHVGTPLRLTLGDLKARPRQEETFTLECSGNNGFPFFTSAIGNARWAGTSLADILNAAQIKSGAVEVVFFGVDHGEEVVHPGTPIEVKFAGNFARSMSVEDAMNPANILCYEMNGEPLPTEHGSPRGARYALSGPLHGP
jgi:DMSO/TMAO reductase YedYZ molybdopterin-dependent catalytic subunit